MIVQDFAKFASLSNVSFCLNSIPVTDSNDDVEFTRLRNGVNTNTQQHNTPGDNEDYTAFMQRRQNSVTFNRGLHETMEYYDDCTKRDRNMSECRRGRERRKEGMCPSTGAITAPVGIGT